MAWMIKAGNVKRSAGGLAGAVVNGSSVSNVSSVSSVSSVSIVAIGSIGSTAAGPCGWRVRLDHPCHRAADDLCQGILETLMQQEYDNEQ